MKVSLCERLFGWNQTNTYIWYQAQGLSTTDLEGDEDDGI